MTESDIIKEELTNLLNAIIKAHIAAGQVASGDTMKSLTVEVDEFHGVLKQKGGAPLQTLDRGRAAGGDPKKLYWRIMRWAEAKGIQFATRQDLQRFSWWTAYRITKEGTALFRNGGRTDIVEDNVQIFVDNLKRRLGEHYTQHIIENIFNNQQS